MTGFTAEVENNGRIHVAAAGSHDQTFQRSHSHGGIDARSVFYCRNAGSIAQVQIDFDTLKNLSRIAREEFGLAGCVQHGASTLPPEAFNKFVEVEAAEVHLATEFQNMVYESAQFPQDLKNRMYEWIDQNLAAEKKEDQTQEQFIYKTRKKALGPFKKEIMNLSQDARDAIVAPIEEKFDFLFKQLNVVNTRELTDKYISLKRVIKRPRRQQIKAAGSEHFEGAD